jgi:hypothetical protein
MAWKSPNLVEDGVISGQVGHHFTASIKWEGIGVYRSNGDYQDLEFVKSAISAPGFCLTGELPPGLTFDATSGTIAGVPRSPGKWLVHPAVRCKEDGDNVYRGTGFWWTDYCTIDGRTWTRPERPTTISISE